MQMNKIVLIVLSCLCIWHPVWAFNATDVNVGGLDAWTLGMSVSMGVIAMCCVGIIVRHLLCPHEPRAHESSVDDEVDQPAWVEPEAVQNNIVPTNNEV